MFFKIYSNGSVAVKQLPQRLYAEVTFLQSIWYYCSLTETENQWKWLCHS